MEQLPQPCACPPACLQIVLVNPQVINLGKSKNLFEEGCLSFPGIYADVEVGRGAPARKGAARGPTCGLSVHAWLCPALQPGPPGCRAAVLTGAALHLSLCSGPAR